MRYFYVICIAALAALSALVAWRAVANPMDGQREWLAGQLADIPPAGAGSNDGDASLVSWQQQIMGKPGLWQELVGPPPAPPPPPPAPPSAPDLRKMLEGVKASTRKVGDSVYMAWPGNEKGSFVAIGEEVKGCKLKAIERDKVTFSYFWKQGNAEIVYDIPRQRKIN